MGAAKANHIPVGGDAMGTSATISEKRERSPAEGVMDTDIPTQT